MSSRSILLVLMAAVMTLAACGEEPAPDDAGTVEAAGNDQAECEQGEVTTDSGLVYEDLECGTGEEAGRGDTAVVHYTGMLENGEEFDSSRGGDPFPVKLGAGDVIQGWEEGLPGMRVGGTRRLTIPPELGYGAAGFPPVIPPNATLIFEVELVDLRSGD